MTQQEFEDLIERLESELEDARDLLRQAQEDDIKRVINQTQKDINRIVLRMSQLKYDQDIVNE